MTPPHSSDPKERFSNRAETYARHRPTYPHAVLDFLRLNIGFDAAKTVADVGSGTGISAQLFLANGNPVFAVEPNAAMRQRAEQSLQDFPRFHSIVGSAEETTLASASIDLVVAAQAFHWFDPIAARKEFSRILRPEGQVLLMWNARKLSGSPFLAAYEQLLEDFGLDYHSTRHDRIMGSILEAFFGTHYVAASFPNHQALGVDGLLGRLTSSSYMPAAGQSGYEEMIAAARELFQKHQQDGRVELAYDTNVYVGRLSESPEKGT